MKVTPSFFQKIEEEKKEIPICLIPHLHVLVVFTQQLEISFDKIISSAVYRVIPCYGHYVQILKLIF